MKDEIKEIKIIKSNHSIVIIKNGVTVKEQFAIDDEILDYITNLQEEIERLNNGCKELEQQIDDLRELETTLTNENDRLNNIINELEKDCIEYLNIMNVGINNGAYYTAISSPIQFIERELEKIKELKGDNNEGSKNNTNNRDNN